MKLVHDASKASTAEMDNLVAATAVDSSCDHLLVDLSECLRLVGGSAANGDSNDPLVLQGEAELKFRRLIAMFGFDRLPFTYGEAHGLLDYCQRIDSAAGFGMMEPQCLESWQQAGFRLFARKLPHLLPALKLFCQRDIEGLRGLHRADDTLTMLGRQYREYSFE